MKRSERIRRRERKKKRAREGENTLSHTPADWLRHILPPSLDSVLSK